MIRETVNSTNDCLKELGKIGAPEGTAMLAHEQRAGRGRMEHVWVSQYGLGLYLSWLIRPPRDFTGCELLGVLSGVPVAQVLRDLFQLDVRLKWSNDLMVGERKLGGILGETVGSGLGRFMVLGLGINCRQHPGYFPPDIRDKATSLAIEGAGECETEKLSRAILEAFSPLYMDILTGKVKKWRDAYQTLSCTLGTWQQRGTGEGMAVGLGERGELLIKQKDGNITSWEL